MQIRQSARVIVATMALIAICPAQGGEQNDRTIEPVATPMEPISQRSGNAIDRNSEASNIDPPDVPSVPDERDAAIYKQDDHLHTTPDKMFATFEKLDVDGDRRIQWQELEQKGYPLPRDEFKLLDTDGSGDLDREEFVAVSPSHESAYSEPGLHEP